MSESPRSGERVVLRTNAKINLFLAVKTRRPDGYHEIETVFHSVSLSDTLEAVRRRNAGISVDMRPAGVEPEALPEPGANLVTRALEAFSRRAARRVDLDVGIAKAIPVAAGLGGGSANAAAALRAANELYERPLGEEQLLAVAAEIGSDVPFCLVGGTALGSGRGERITVLQAPPLHFVLGISRERLLTRDVYGRAEARPGGPAAGAFVSVLEQDDPTAIAAALRNDLETAALELLPALTARKDALLTAGAVGAQVCGSGPTIFGIARDEPHARQVARSVRGSFHRVEVVRSRPQGLERVLP